MPEPDPVLRAILAVYYLGIVFDVVSCVGLLGYGVLVTGLAWLT